MLEVNSARLSVDAVQCAKNGTVSALAIALSLAATLDDPAQSRRTVDAFVANGTAVLRAVGRKAVFVFDPRLTKPQRGNDTSQLDVERLSRAVASALKEFVR